MNKPEFPVSGLIILLVLFSFVMEDIDVDTAYNMITNGSYPDLVILDVRTQGEYDSGHIYSAVWIPVTELESRIDELAGHKAHEILVYCRSGARSANASGILDSNKFTKVHNMLDGFSAWQLAGYQVWISTVHNINTTFNYDTIQTAIDAQETMARHKIIVDQGVYLENVVVNKAIMLIGSDKYSTVIDGNGTGIVVSITQDNVSLTGFTIKGGGSVNGVDAGVSLENTKNCSILNNIVRDNNFFGITILNSQGIQIAKNSIIGNKIWAVHLANSDNNTIEANNLEDNWGDVDIHSSSNYNKITENNMKNSTYSIIFNNARNNFIQGNTIMQSSLGIWLQEGVENTFIRRNNLIDSDYGIKLETASGNTFYHNNFMNNSIHVSFEGYAYANSWDNSFEGNYWNDYVGVDMDFNGIGDMPHIIETNNLDNHPMLGLFSRFNTSEEEHVDVISNSTIEDFTYFESNSTIRIHVSNMTRNQTHGFIRISVPHSLMTEPYNITVNGVNPTYWNYSLHDNGSHRWIYFAYEHSTIEIVIIPEFPSLIILPLFMIATLLAGIFYRRRKMVKSNFTR
jgi:parallel beta-helix repeat protein